MAKRIELSPLPHVAAIYARVSTAGQGSDDKDSLPSQLHACRQWCASNGWAVLDDFVYQDKHTGEEWYERPQLRQMLEDATARKFGLVIALSVDRLSRTHAHVGIILDRLQRAGVMLDFVTEKLDDTPEGRMVLAVRSFAAEMENARRRERMERTTRARVERGLPIFSNRPTYGYMWPDERDEAGRLVKRRFIEHSEHSQVVRRIFHEAISGKTLRAIASGLGDDGIPTPGGGKYWNPTTVRCILKNPIYWGAQRALKFMGVPVPPDMRAFYAHKTRRVERPLDEQVLLPADIAPALVPAEYAERIATILEENQRMALRNNQHAHEIESILRGGYIRCGYCGGAMYSNRIPSRRGGDRAVYRCKNATRVRGKCSPHAVDTHVLDDAVWSRIIELLKDPALIQYEVQQMEATGDSTPHATALVAIEQRLAELDRKRKNLAQVAAMIDDAEAAAEVAANLSALTAERRQVEAERVRLQARATTWQEVQEGLAHVVDWGARVAENVNALSYDNKRAVLRALKVDVRLYRADHEPRCTMSITLPLSGEIPLQFDGLASGAAAQSADCVEVTTRAAGKRSRAVRA